MAKKPQKQTGTLTPQILTSTLNNLDRTRK